MGLGLGLAVPVQMGHFFMTISRNIGL